MQRVALVPVLALILSASACGGGTAKAPLKPAIRRIDHTYAAGLKSVAAAMNDRLSVFMSQNRPATALRTIQAATRHAATALRGLHPPANARVYNAALADSLAFLSKAVARLRGTIVSNAPGEEYQALLTLNGAKELKHGVWALARLRALGYPVQQFGLPAAG